MNINEVMIWMKEELKPWCAQNNKAAFEMFEASEYASSSLEKVGHYLVILQALDGKIPSPLQNKLMPAVKVLNLALGQDD